MRDSLNIKKYGLDSNCRPHWGLAKQYYICASGLQGLDDQECQRLKPYNDVDCICFNHCLASVRGGLKSLACYPGQWIYLRAEYYANLF